MYLNRLAYLVVIGDITAVCEQCLKQTPANVYVA